MKTKTLRTAVLTLLALMFASDIAAQSGMYVCGHFRRQRPNTVTNLRNSGYTNAILFNVNVEEDGTLTTDYDWNNQSAAEAGGIICKNGEYVFDKYQPYYINDVKNLLRQPTSIQRIEICIGGWGNGSYGKIKQLIEKEGTGENSMLYKNFKALKEAIPEITAVNNDQEQDYDVQAAVDFHVMMYDLGYKTTIAPYTYREFWQGVVSGIQKQRKDAIELVYLQTYGGGAGNNPADWVFDGIPMWVGFDNESNWNLNEMVTKFTNWKNTCNVTGGFLWNYNNENHNLNEWATAINRIFREDIKDEDVAAKVYSDADYKGYCIKLPVGKFTMADLALYGVKAQDLSSIEVAEGYQVMLYKSSTCNGTPLTLTESSSYVGDSWNDKVRSIKIESLADGIENVESDNDSNTLDADKSIYNLAGQQVSDNHKGIVIQEGRKFLKK